MPLDARSFKKHTRKLRRMRVTRNRFDGGEILSAKPSHSVNHQTWLVASLRARFLAACPRGIPALLAHRLRNRRNPQAPHHGGVLTFWTSRPAHARARTNINQLNVAQTNTAFPAMASTRRATLKRVATCQHDKLVT
jgi:hypothetical protein